MQYFINEYMSSSTQGGTAVYFRTDDLIKWLDKIQELKQTFNIKKSRCCFFQHIRHDGTAQTFFVFWHRTYRKETAMNLPFVKKPVLIFKGFPEGDS